MIREANRFDRDEIITLMKEFRDAADFIEVLADDNVEYWHRLLESIFAGAGKIFYAEGKGLLMSAILPTIWDDKIFALHELAWFVRPEFRGSTVGYRLLDAYVTYGKALKEAGRHNSKKDVCAKGHPFVPENTYVTKSGWRACETCRATWRAEYAERKRALAARAHWPKESDDG